MANVDGRYVCQGVRWRSSGAVFPHWRSLPDHIETGSRALAEEAHVRNAGEILRAANCSAKSPQISKAFVNRSRSNAYRRSFFRPFSRSVGRTSCFAGHRHHFVWAGKGLAILCLAGQRPAFGNVPSGAELALPRAVIVDHGGSRHG